MEGVARVLLVGLLLLSKPSDVLGSYRQNLALGGGSSDRNRHLDPGTRCDKGFLSHPKKVCPMTKLGEAALDDAGSPLKTSQAALDTPPRCHFCRSYPFNFP